MTLDALISQIVAAGSVITTHGVSYTPWQAEVILSSGGNRQALFWVNVQAQDQHDTHSLEFSDWKVSGQNLGVSFFDERGSFIGYLGRASDTPEIDADQVAEALADMEHMLRDGNARAAWDDMVSVAREDAKNSLEISG